MSSSFEFLADNRKYDTKFDGPMTCGYGIDASFTCEKKIAAGDCGMFREMKITNDVKAMAPMGFFWGRHHTPASEASSA
jgi:hypothetical protein